MKATQPTHRTRGGPTPIIHNLVKECLVTLANKNKSIIPVSKTATIIFSTFRSKEVFYKNISHKVMVFVNFHFTYQYYKYHKP